MRFEDESPGLEQYESWGGVYGHARRIRIDVREYLVWCQLRNGEEYLELERCGHDHGRQGAVHSRVLLEHISVRSLEVEPFVRLALSIRHVRSSGIMDDERELRVEPVRYLVGLLGVIGHGRRREEAQRMDCDE